MHGYGCYEFCNTFYEGMPSQVLLPNQAIGDFERNVRQGNGVMEFSDGQLYEGTFKKGLPGRFLDIIYLRARWPRSLGDAQWRQVQWNLVQRK